MADAAEESRRPVPQAVLDSEVDDIWLPYWRAFHRLSKARGMTSGLVTVPERLKYPDIALYARNHGFFHSVADFEFFDEIICELDDLYIEFYVEKAKEAMPAKGSRR